MLLERLVNNIENHREEFKISVAEYLDRYENTWVNYLIGKTKQGQTFFPKRDFPGYLNNEQTDIIFFSALQAFATKHGLPMHMGCDYINLQPLTKEGRKDEGTDIVSESRPCSMG